ncbi:MAG: glycosyltransferase family 9 protein [Bdellovibrionales bacterium]|nr:glycosyltransferase family 9 protein [Bdellovibrionales bacterium]
MRVAVVQTAFLGDLLLSIPLLKQLRAELNCEISLVCRKGFGGLLLELGIVDSLHEVEKGNRDSYSQAAIALNSQSLTHLICPHQSFRTGLFAAKVRVSGLKVSFSSWWGRAFFSRTLNKPMQLPDALRQLSLLKLLSQEFSKKWDSHDWEGLVNSAEVDENVDYRDRKIPEWATMRVESTKLNSKRQESFKTILVAPGSVWATKKWTETGFAEVVAGIADRGDRVVLIGSPAEIEVCDRVVSEALSLLGKGVAKDMIVSRAGQDSLLQSLQLMANSNLLLSNDSGAMHLAAISGLPTVSVFGPTVLSFGYRPWNQQSIVVQKGLECRPCGKHGHKVCPIATHECMKSIKSSMVTKAAQQLLS